MSLHKGLGKAQRECLRALQEHKEWIDHPMSRWSYSSQSETRRIMESLVARGLVRKLKTVETFWRYRLVRKAEAGGKGA